MGPLRILLACCVALLLTVARGTAAEPQRTAAPAAASKVEPDAVAALDKMVTALRAHDSATLTADTTNEDVLNTGEKLQYSGKIVAVLRRPDRFRISIQSDTRNRDFYYDGKTVTVFSPRLGYYADFPAPATIRATLEEARHKYDMQLPLAELFGWGTGQETAAQLKSGFLVRSEHIDGQICNHYAFRQEKVDWQVWLAADTSLPCKLVITSRKDPSMPQYTALLHWDFTSPVSDSDFAFVPPAGSSRIAIATAVSMRGAKP